jgi:hypothetical protein
MCQTRARELEGKKIVDLILDGVDPAVFGHHLTWRYTLRLPSRHDNGTSKEYLDLANAYLLSHILEDGAFADLVLDAFVEKLRCPDSAAVSVIFNQTGLDDKFSEARRLMVDIYTFGCESTTPTRVEVGDTLP